MFSQLKFKYPFRRYQQMILENIVPIQTDNKYHLAAPPGAGKTIIGLEMIRRFDAPAVIFAPTTTIQLQWREKLKLFLEDVQELDCLASLEPDRPAPVNIFTYQLISAPGESQKRVEQMAVQYWQQELLEQGQLNSELAAGERLALIKANNPAQYRKELAARYGRVKHQLLSGEGVDVGEFLHPNAHQLIDTLVRYGVRTVVLDECHHLLDYWAIVLRHLIARIDNPRVVGLTATLPSPDGDAEFENYNSLLGEVDFEVPTPAVVKEGDLAPYRDLAYFVKPSRRESDYLKNIQSEFENAISTLTDSPPFRAWVTRTVLEPFIQPGSQASWSDYWKEHPLFSMAGFRFLNRIGTPIPPTLSVPVDTTAPMSLEDWSVLIERYALDVLTVSADKNDHATLKRLRETLLPFGLTLTERGIHHGRSAGDLVLTFSEAKDVAVRHILSRECAALGSRLRAIVVTDFERMNSGVNRLTGVLDKDAGSAWRLFKALAGDPAVAALNPLLVTARTVMVAALHKERMQSVIGDYLAGCKANASISFRALDGAQAFEVVGEGPDWRPRTYVGMVTAFLEQGLTRCVVGTRGIFGEGWDSLSLNVLVDLTSVTTSTSVQQLRGRSIRLDPAWPHKVAHNWDVICVARGFEKGMLDFDRFQERHQQYWGLVVAGAGDTVTPSSPRLHGKIAKGILHVCPAIVTDLLRFENFRMAHYNRLMMNQVPKREQAYSLWQVGEEYSNFPYSVTDLNPDDLKIRTVFSIQTTLKAMIRKFTATLIASGALVFYYFLRGSGYVSRFLKMDALCLLAILWAFVVTVFLVNARQAIKLARKFFVQQPPDAILLDVGRAVLASLRDAGLVSRNLVNEYVRVVEMQDDSYHVFVDYASPQDADTFTRAYRDVFEPVFDQRYLILRDDERLPNIGLRPFWLVLRRLVRQAGQYPPAFYPVPKALSIRKELAEKFAANWKKFVGGGKLVFTRSEEGGYALLTARAQRRPSVKNLAFEIWR